MTLSGLLACFEGAGQSQAGLSCCWFCAERALSIPVWAVGFAQRAVVLQWW